MGIDRKYERGVTLIELLTVIAIIAILAGMAALSADFIRREDVNRAAREFLADAQRARSDAMTRGPSAAGPGGGTLEVRGFGIKFTPPTSYSVFTFVDANTDWQYTDATEEDALNTRSMRGTIKLGSVDAGGNAVDIIIFDRYGYVRKKDWTPVDSVNVFFTHPSLGDTHRKCVSIQLTKIREGFWNGTTCAEQ